MAIKRLYLVRHAKSSWKDSLIADHDRPLNKRGERDIPRMSQKVRDLGVIPQKVISSTALRASETARGFASTLMYLEQEIHYTRDLYHASPSEILNVISSVEDKYFDLMVFGHNPGLTYLSNQLTRSFIDNIPTCGVAAISLEIDSWSEVVGAEKGNLLFFEFPKNLK